MFGPTKHSPMKTFTDDRNATTHINFTRNLHELKYRASGTGRDSYIYSNNGGFGVQNTVAPNQNPSSRFPVSRRQKSLSPPLASTLDTQRPRIYNVDGSGRDTYIHANNGGFTGFPMAACQDPRITFK